MKRLMLVGIASLLLFAGYAPAAERKGMLRPAEVKALIANAKTAAGHFQFAGHFTAMAEKHEAEAREHEALASEYRRNPRLSETKLPGAPDTAGHCKFFAEPAAEQLKKCGH